MNWAIGDPERKVDYVITTKDVRIGNVATVLVKSDSFPKASGYEFIQIAKDLYAAQERPQKIGISNVLGASYGVNYPLEYEQVGMNPVLVEKAQQSGGKLFSPDDVDAIIEHVKTRSTRTIVKETSLQWPFLLGALAIFLFEIIIRRVSRWS